MRLTSCTSEPEGWGGGRCGKLRSGECRRDVARRALRELGSLRAVGTRPLQGEGVSEAAHLALLGFRCS